MKNKQEHWIEDITGRRKTLIALGLVSIIAIASMGIGLWAFSGSLYGDDQEITWNAEVGDVYYHGLFDRYDWGDGEKEFLAILKSEIIKVEDLSLDLDDDDDLVIMSSFMSGIDGVFTVEFPNYFDIYYLLLMGYNIEEILFGSTSTSYNQTKNLFDFSLPSAIHYQTSGIYHDLKRMVDQFGIGQLGELEFPEFNNTNELIDFIFNNLKFKNAYEENFEDFNLGYDISPFVLKTDFLYDNYASISSFGSSKMLNLTQNSGVKNDLEVSLDLFGDGYLGSEPLALRVDLEDYLFRPNYLSYELNISENSNHTIETQLVSDEFNFINIYVGGTPYNLSGVNGIDFRFNNGLLQYYVGDYTWEEGSGILDSGYLRNTDSAEKGWFNVSATNYTQVFYSGSPNGDTFEIQIESDFDTFIILDSDKWKYDIRISNTEGIYYSDYFYDIPIRMDCPFDFLSPNIFRMENMSNLNYLIYGTETSRSCDLIDNIYIDGDIIHFLDSFENLVEDFFYSQILLLSIYHMMFFPNELDYDVIVSMVEIVNQFAELTFGIEDFFNIDDDDDYLKIIMSYDTFDALRTLIHDLFLNALGISFIGYIDGDLDVKYTLNFDKRIDCLNESYFTIRYNELDVTREIGMELLAVRNKDGDAKYGEYPAYASDLTELEETVDELITYTMWAFLIGIVGSVFTMTIIVEITHLIRKRRNLE